MATPIDELVIQIRADTKQLQKDLDKIKGKLKTTGTTGAASFAGASAASGVLAGSLSKLAGPVAIGAVIIGMTKLTAFSLRAGMEFEDLKDSLDTVFGSISAGDKQFDRILRFAQTTPFQIDTVTKAFISLGSVGITPTTRMMQVFADTASVAIDQKGAFEALIRVVQRAEAGALGLQELNMLADRGIDVFKGLKEELGLSRLELTDFGQTAGGAKIIVEALTNVLEKQFGGAMVAKMDNLSVAISNMQIAFKSLGNEIFESRVGDFFKDITNSISAAVNALAVGIASMRGSGLGMVLESPTMSVNMDFDQMQAERARVAQRNIDNIKSKIEGLEGDDVGIIGKLFVGSLRSGATNPVQIAEQVKMLIGLSKTLGISQDDAAKLVENLNKALEDEEQNLDNAKKKQRELTLEQKNAMLSAGKLVRAYGLVEKHLKDLAGDTDILAFAQKNLEEIFKDNEAALVDLGVKSAKELGIVFQTLQSEMSELNSISEEMKLVIIQTSHAFTKDFVDSLLDGENALDSFKNFAKNMVSQIIAIFLEMAVVNEILNNVFGLTGSSKLATLSGSKGTSVSSGGRYGGGGTRASGGTVQAGRPYNVGERGAEIFVPNTGGTIMNNMNSKNAMGGGGTVINQSINFATGVVPTVRAEVMKMMPQIADVTKGAVAEAAMRGGNYRRMLQGG